MFVITVVTHKPKHSHNHNLFWFIRSILYTISSTGICKFYKSNSNDLLFTAINSCVSFYITQKLSRIVIFFNILNHLKNPSYEALELLLCSMIARPPYCYYRSKKWRCRRVSSWKFCVPFVVFFLNPHTKMT